MRNAMKVETWAILKETGREFMEDKVLRLSAALAYYALFSIGPLLIIVVGLTSLALGKESVRYAVEHQLQGFMGENAATTVESMMAAHKESDSLVATIVGIVALLFGASGVFGQLQDSLNSIWEVKAAPGQGVWGFIRNRFISFTMVLGMGFLLLVSLVLTTILSSFTAYLGQAMKVPAFLGQLLDTSVSFLVITLLFAMIFKVLPDAQVRWRDVWIGSIATALLFTTGKLFLGLYLGRESTASAYGAAGSVVVILMWVYYSSVILLSGAEFTQVYAKRVGSGIQPSKHAVTVTEGERREQGMPHAPADSA